MEIEDLSGRIKRYRFNHVRRERFIEEVIHDDFSERSICLFDELYDTSISNPQEFINAIRTFLRDNHDIMFLADYFFRRSKESQSNHLLVQIERIAIFWEVTSFLKYTAYLFSKRNIRLETAKKSGILKQFKFVGWDSKDIQSIREIRNAHFHPFTFSEDHLIDNEKRKVATFEEIENISKEVDSLISWWVRTLLFSMYFNPKIFIYAFYIIRSELKNNKEMYLSMVRLFGPFLNRETVTDENNQSEELPILSIWIANTWRFIKNPIQVLKTFVYKKIADSVFEKMIRQYSVSKEQALEYIQSIQKKLYELGEEMRDLSQELENSDDKAAMREYGVFLMKESERVHNSPKEFIDYVRRSMSRLSKDD